MPIIVLSKQPNKLNMAPQQRFSPHVMVMYLLPAVLTATGNVAAYVPSNRYHTRHLQQTITRNLHNNIIHLPYLSTALSSESKSIMDVESPVKVSFIDTELRGAAMKLHTRKQAPKEGEAEEKPQTEPYITTHSDYLAFLVDSQHVYAAMEEAVNTNSALKSFRDTGMERTSALETDIQLMVDEFDLLRPAVGQVGLEYAKEIKRMVGENSIPELMCHYYNHYFAHTAGGRMIGKRMSALLLNKRTLEFYKWDGDISEIKERVKDSIEEMAASWNEKERQECVDATAAAFRLGGGMNSYLRGGHSAH